MTAGLTVRPCPVFADRWDIARDASGLPLPVHFVSEHDALRAADDLDGLCDWTTPTVQTTAEEIFRITGRHGGLVNARWMADPNAADNPALRSR